MLRLQEWTSCFSWCIQVVCWYAWFCAYNPHPKVFFCGVCTTRDVFKTVGRYDLSSPMAESLANIQSYGKLRYDLTACLRSHTSLKWMKIRYGKRYLPVACVQTITKLWLVLGVNQSLISSARRLTYQWREEIYIVADLLFAKNGEAPSKKLATVVAI